MRFSVIAKSGTPDQSLQRMNEGGVFPGGRHAEHPFDLFLVPLGDSASEIPGYVPMNETQEIVKVLLGVLGGDVGVVVFVLGI